MSAVPEVFSVRWQGPHQVAGAAAVAVTGRRWTLSLNLDLNLALYL
jgi:hypothetical protein